MAQILTIVFSWMILIGYLVSVILINLYCLTQLWLFVQSRKKNKIESPSDPAEWPAVAVQLPVYNEKYVIERLLDNIIKLDYPREKLEIQILDDSTDETSSLIKNKITEYASYNIAITHIQRTLRTGFKAGALREGLEQTKAEFVAIFDADFLPEPDFLKKTVPYFHDRNIGVVQTRWAHINTFYSRKTIMQAMQLNVHFFAEQPGRQSAGLFLQFNGTGGVWRKKAILDAGNWQDDTLTEDLDLSYRAQLKGWKIQYLTKVGTPSELPVEMNGLKAQQHRWMKGGAETARKLIPKILSSDLSGKIKIHAAIHLLNSSVFLVLIICMISSFGVSRAADTLGWNLNILAWLPLGLLSLFIIYYQCNKHLLPEGNKLKRLITFISFFFSFLALSSGLSYHNARAVWLGFRGRKSAFVRTPKFNIQSKEDRVRKKSYLSGPSKKVLAAEIFITLILLIALIVEINTASFQLLYFHLLLLIGYFGIIYYTIRDACQSH